MFKVESSSKATKVVEKFHDWKVRESDRFMTFLSPSKKILL